jgi:hypothetical protein
MKKHQNGDFLYYFMKNAILAFFCFIMQKSTKMAIFHIILWKNAVLAYLLYFIKQKSAKMSIFHIIL